MMYIHAMRTTNGWLHGGGVSFLMIAPPRTLVIYLASFLPSRPNEDKFLREFLVLCFLLFPRRIFTLLDVVLAQLFS